MSREKNFFSTPKFIIFLVAIAAIVVFTGYLLREANKRSSAAPGVPTLSYSIDPDVIHPTDGFDLIIKVNPNGAVFNAFELYSTYDPALVNFQDQTDLSVNISSSYILINSSIDTTSNRITIIGTATGGGFSGNSEMEIARVRMLVNDSAFGDVTFVWNPDTKIGAKIARETVDGIFPITPFGDITPPDTTPPDVTPPTSADTSLSFRLRLPDVTAPIVSLSDAEVTLELNNSPLEKHNFNLVQSGNYYQTGSPVVFNNVQSGASYSIYVKTKVTVGRRFSNITLNQGQTLDCITTADSACGDLFSSTDVKLLDSGDSDGFDTASGSYNLIDSADLQVVNQFFNQPAGSGPYSADFNLDGQVNISDLEIIGKNYGISGD